MASMTNLQQGVAVADHDVDDAVRNHPFYAGLKASSLRVLFDRSSSRAASKVGTWSDAANSSSPPNRFVEWV